MIKMMVLSGAMGIGLLGCAETSDDPAASAPTTSSASDALNDAADKAGQAVDDAADKVGDAIDDAADKAGDKINEITGG